MFFSSNVIPVRYSSNIDILPMLDSHMFLENDSFFAIDFYSKESKDVGEIQWSNSFFHGKLNVVYFLRKVNIFFLFSSAIQNYIYLEKILKRIDPNIKVEILKIPLNPFKPTNIEQIVKSEVIPYLCLKATVKINDQSFFLNIYTNGLITYSMTNDTSILDQILDISIKLIQETKDSNEQ